MGELRPPFPKGVSFNPGGRPGRPAGKSLSKMLQEFMDNFTMEQLRQMTECEHVEGCITPREGVALQWLRQMLAGDARAREQALDRLEGSVAQTMRHELSRVPTMTPAEVIAKLQQDQSVNAVGAEHPEPSALIDCPSVQGGSPSTLDAEIVDPGASQVPSVERVDVPRGQAELGPPNIDQQGDRNV